MTAPLDLLDQRFGRLRVIEKAPNIGRRTAWRCRCDCGRSVVVRTEHLRGGRVVSCRCARTERTAVQTKTHGASRSRTYVSWLAMKARCENSRVHAYKDYGGRGISVCERWQRFENFLADMGERPPDRSLDRVDVDGNYEPGNCRWADRITQANNTRWHKRRRAINSGTP